MFHTQKKFLKPTNQYPSYVPNINLKSTCISIEFWYLQCIRTVWSSKKKILIACICPVPDLILQIYSEFIVSRFDNHVDVVISLDEKNHISNKSDQDKTHFMFKHLILRSLSESTLQYPNRSLMQGFQIQFHIHPSFYRNPYFHPHDVG